MSLVVRVRFTRVVGTLVQGTVRLLLCCIVCCGSNSKETNFAVGVLLD